MNQLKVTLVLGEPGGVRAAAQFLVDHFVSDAEGGVCVFFYRKVDADEALKAVTVAGFDGRVEVDDEVRAEGFYSALCVGGYNAFMAWPTDAVPACGGMKEGTK